jgi:hypothetical protein
MDLQKVGRLYDFRAAEVPQSQKMIVAGNKLFRLGGNSAFMDAIGGRVFRDGVYTLLRFDVQGKPRDLHECARDLDSGQPNFSAAEDRRHFVENVIGNGEVDRA